MFQEANAPKFTIHKIDTDIHSKPELTKWPVQTSTPLPIKGYFYEPRRGAAKLEFKEPPGPCTIWIFEVAIEHGRHLCCIFISEAIEFRFELDG